YGFPSFLVMIMNLAVVKMVLWSMLLVIANRDGNESGRVWVRPDLDANLA
ncbi:hypothetical protein AMTR_s00256p00018210, partial [Amborella trichopoda]